MWKAIGIGALVVLGIAALIGVGFLIANNANNDLTHYNVNYVVQSLKIQGVERVYYAQKDPIPQGVDTFHLILPGGQQSASPTLSQTGGAGTLTPTPFQPAAATEVAVPETVAGLQQWRVVNPNNCTCYERNAVGDATGPLSCVNDEVLPGGTSMTVYCPNNNNFDFYFELVH